MATWPYDIPVGNMPEAPGGSTEEVLYLIPVGAEDRELNLQFYNVELIDELQILVNGVEAGYAPITALNQWGDIYIVVLNANQLALVEVQSGYTGLGLTWGVRLDWL
jgi:hypothetical protein